MSKPDGGPAFPIYTPDMPIEGSPGMTLRDWFAGQALAGLMHPKTLVAMNNVGKDDPSIALARAAYAAADAMLEEREK